MPFFDYPLSMTTDKVYPKPVLTETKQLSGFHFGLHPFFLVLIVCCALALLAGCAGKQGPLPPQDPKTTAKQLPALGYTIQVGAFAHFENAVRLTEKLEKKGLEPYYFHHPSGLYKVRFGNFPTRQEAETRARQLQSAGHIAAFYILRPQDYTLAKAKVHGPGHLRDQLVQTAQGFLGLPYQWGGTRPAEGFDCSGLTMAVYRLNGLHLPRTSREQFRAGTAISRKDLSKGDLVFFAPSRSKISHVGMYTGNGRFIHAPSTGKTVRFSSLGSRYYRKHYAGARSYLR
ncbi:MAG: C40 family peptidase [Desulfovermiculus sp.]|nr:C40 family peptidase [Desulfovermiculus sp.]